MTYITPRKVKLSQSRNVIGKNLEFWGIFWKSLKMSTKNKEKSEFATFTVTFVRSTKVTNGKLMTLFHQNLMLNLTQTFAWPRSEGKVEKNAI